MIVKQKFRRHLLQYLLPLDPILRRALMVGVRLMKFPDDFPQFKLTPPYQIELDIFSGRKNPVFGRDQPNVPEDFITEFLLPTLARYYEILQTLRFADSEFPFLGYRGFWLINSEQQKMYVSFLGGNIHRTVLKRLSKIKGTDWSVYKAILNTLEGRNE